MGGGRRKEKTYQRGHRGGTEITEKGQEEKEKDLTQRTLRKADWRHWGVNRLRRKKRAGTRAQRETGGVQLSDAVEVRWGEMNCGRLGETPARVRSLNWLRHAELDLG